MNAARAERDEVAPLYLDTPLRGRAAVELAHTLFVVLDSRLPARLTDLSDRPEGSRSNPLKPDQDVVGVITTAGGTIELVLERVSRGSEGPVWRFSRQTLDAIPDVFVEVFAYVCARDWDAFLETQQDLMLDIMSIVERSGARMALPSQTLHLADGLPQGRAAIAPGSAEHDRPAAEADPAQEARSPEGRTAQPVEKTCV